jgi:hypothetical protein
MKTDINAKTKVVIVFMVFSVVSCSVIDHDIIQKQPSLLASEHVVSLKTLLSEFENLAQNWHADYYLVSVSLPVGYKDHKPYLCAVSYASPSDRLTLSIIKTLDGQIITEHNSNFSDSSDAIDANDWVLDSLEVFDLAYNYLKPEYAKDENGYFCGRMILRRNPNIPGKPVVWRVYFDNCTSRIGEPIANIIIDPISGMEIQRTILTSSDRFPELNTPMP